MTVKKITLFVFLENVSQHDRTSAGMRTLTFKQIKLGQYSRLRHGTYSTSTYAVNAARTSICAHRSNCSFAHSLTSEFNMAASSTINTKCRLLFFHSDTFPGLFLKTSGYSSNAVQRQTNMLISSSSWKGNCDGRPFCATNAPIAQHRLA